MKVSFKRILVVFAVVALGLGFNFAQAADVIQPGYKAAVVDVNAIVQKSAQVQALKKEQQQKLQDLQKWLETVRADINKQSTQENKDKLAKKYNEELAKKQAAISENYAKKLQAIDKSITATISNYARANGYNIVIAKGTVLYGGDDITEAVSKEIK